MKKHARWLLAVMLTVAMTMSCLPAASAAGGSKKAKAFTPDLSAWGLNVDLSGVPAQVRQAVTNMIADGQEPLEKETDQILVEVVEEASGISFDAVKTNLGLALLGGAEGTVDTSRFNLGQEEFNRVMKEVLSEYFLTDLAYSCSVKDGIVTGIRFMSASDASSYRRMYTASDLWSMYAAPMSGYTMTASQVENDPADGEEGETGETETTNERTVTLQVKWKDNNKKANRPDSVTVCLTDTEDSENSHYYSFETVSNGEAEIVVPDKNAEGEAIEYVITEEDLDEEGNLPGKNDVTYSVAASQDGDTYTVTNTANDVSGVDYDVTFNWVRDDQFVQATEDEIAQGAYQEINGVKIALTLVYDAENQSVGYGLKTSVDFKLESVTLTPTDGSGEPVTIDAEDASVSYSTMYAFQGNEVPDPSYLGDYASYASTIKYGTYDCEYGTFEDRLDVTASAEEIHWNQMLTFTRDFAKHFGVAGDFWTSKNDPDSNPYGAFKTQLDSYPDDYMPDSVMDYYMENMTLAYMADEMNYGALLDLRIQECLDQLDGQMTKIQKYLVIHDWMANNCIFDMGLMSDMMAGVEGANPTPSQMTAFGALLYDAIGCDGCICLGYAATYALLIQHAFPEVYLKEVDGEYVTDNKGDYVWKNATEVGNNDIVDLVQIRFFGELSEISVSPEFGGDGYFNSVHYYNAVRVDDEWYCVDPAYDDINPEVMSQCRVETDGNISHKYFMIAPTNMLSMFEDRIDYIDCLYDGVVFERERNDDGTPKSETINGNQTHYFWTKKDARSEQECDDDQYEATWFSGATSQVTYDEDYWYYITGPSMSYAKMMDMMDEMGDDNDFDMSDQEDEPENKDQLVRRPRDKADKPVKQQGGSSTSDMEAYDDPYEEILFHFGYGSLVPGDSEEYGDYYDLIQVDEFYQDLYPDLAHGLGLYEGVLYFNLGNQIYTLEVTSEDGSLNTSNDVEFTLLKEYNDVYANSNGKNFTGMSFYAAEEGEDNAFHVFNRPIAAISIEEKVSYKDEYQTNEAGDVVGKTTVRDGDPVPTLTVSIATNFSESNKDAEGNTYTLEALDYNPDYSMYNKMDEDDEFYEYENTNEEFLWCANVVDTIPMEAMLDDKDNGEDDYVTVRAWCGQDGYKEQRTVKYGLSIPGSRTDPEVEDPALNHHFIYNDLEECYVCVHCNDSWHEEYPADFDRYEKFPEGATKGHTLPEDVKGDWYDTEDGEKGCKVSFTCTEKYCGAVVENAECDIEKTSATDEETGKLTNIYTATYYGQKVGSVLTKVCEHNNMTLVEAKEATCTEDGNKAYYECADCGKLFEDAEGQTVTTKEKVTIPATGHSWDDGVVTKAATCTEKGVKTYTCSVCKETKTEAIPALGHSYGDDGKCTVCGETKPAEPSGGGGGGGGGGGREYEIIVEKSAHGTVTPEWESAMKGDTVTLTVKPDAGYKLETLSVAGKGGSVVKVTEKNGVYSFDMPAFVVVVKATFVPAGAVQSGFVDVDPNAYYADAVKWAAENGITGGKDATHFAPNDTCTRAQAVTFLWRAAGSPAPKTTVNPFTDVKAGAYYYDAVLWAVENGITKGTTDTTFSPNATCSRAQIVTFLWRSQKSPAASAENPFTDVAASAYYNNAVLWAVKNGITGGTTATTFSPNNNCTRAQIVTFLYRNVNG